MELYYNPDVMPEEEIKATFVARHKLVDELVALIEHQRDGAGVQHVVIIAPRGMGKTTVLLMVKFAIKDRGLDEQWQSIKFPEESYGVYDLADFWLETLDLLAVETKDETLRQRAEDLKRKYPNNDELQEAAYALLKDWRRKYGKRLLLLVENFDQILEQINDERDNARLRDVLMNDDTMMLLGGATAFFKEARAYDQPLYNFFKIYDLADLKFEQMQELLRRRAALEEIPNFEEKLKVNASGLRALKYFTGGNPRLVLMLYRIVAQSDLTEVRRGLEKLLDEVTPYYKAKVEILPPQQRKIVDHIARVSGETNEGLTPGEIAAAVRLPPNQVSAQLKRLSELGYVRAANLRGRSSSYTLSEPFYAIWHQMRFSRNVRQRMRWLVVFLKAWYASEEMEDESSRLEIAFREHLFANHLWEARDVLEHHRYLAEAMGNAPARARAMESVIRGYLEIRDTETIRGDLLDGIRLSDLSNRTLSKLLEANCISDEQFVQATKIRPRITGVPLDEEFAEALADVILALGDQEFEEALQRLDKVLKLRPDDDEAWFARGITLDELGHHKEAIASYDRALEIKPSVGAWARRGLALAGLGRNEDAIMSYEKSLKIEPDAVIWGMRGFALMELERYKSALESFDRALEVDVKHDFIWVGRGVALATLERNEEAVESYDKALEIDPNDYESWYNRGVAFYKLGRNEEALASYDRALEIKPDDHDAWNSRGAALYDLGRNEEAIASYGRALEIMPDYHAAWNNRGIVYLSLFVNMAEQGNVDLAKQNWNKALESGGRIEDEDWPNEVSAALLGVAKAGQQSFVRRLISESNLEQELFPLARAIDYLHSGDEALIEKLSPEVKGIVEEVVAKLRPVAQKAEQSKNK